MDHLIKMTPALFLLLALAFNGLCDIRQVSPSPWTWVCENESCSRSPASNTSTRVSMDICKLNCDKAGSLLPKPTGTTVLGKGITPLYPAKINFTGYETYPQPMKDMITSGTEIFKGYLFKMHPEYNGVEDPFGTVGAAGNNSLLISINISQVNWNDTSLKLTTDESYTLNIQSDPDNRTVRADIGAVTYFGARHGLETLSQLIAYDEDINAVQVVNAVNISDAPAYPYRGISLDTARNYFSVESILKVIDGMSYNKLNMFHWHITDTHSFPMQVTAYPQMTKYGAYSPKKIYTVSDMKGIVDYARVRGVKIVPEFDEPAHTGNGWQWGPEENLGELVVCNGQEPWYDYCVEPPCGQLNIVNDNVYNILGGIFQSMLSIFDNDLFHMGGDEVDFRCYNSSSLITDWMTGNNYSTDTEGFLNLWSRFQNKAHEKLLKASKEEGMQAIVWTSGLTELGHVEKYLNNSEYIIQIWSGVEDEIIPGLVNKGYRAIFSNYDTMYLDCGFSAWIGDGLNWCSPYKAWQVVYENSPYKIYENFTNTSMADAARDQGLLLGSETPLWTEQTDELSVEGRLWPRASAHAERLWTNPKTTGWMEAEFRMVTNRQRFVQRGLRPDRLQPEYCSQNQNQCYGPIKAPEEAPEEIEKEKVNGAGDITFGIPILAFSFVSHFLF